MLPGVLPSTLGQSKATGLKVYLGGQPNLDCDSVAGKASKALLSLSASRAGPPSGRIPHEIADEHGIKTTLILCVISYHCMKQIRTYS